MTIQQQATSTTVLDSKLASLEMQTYAQERNKLEKSADQGDRKQLTNKQQTKRTPVLYSQLCTARDAQHKRRNAIETSQLTRRQRSTNQQLTERTIVLYSQLCIARDAQHKRRNAIETSQLTSRPRSTNQQPAARTPSSTANRATRQWSKNSTTSREPSSTANVYR